MILIFQNWSLSTVNIEINSHSNLGVSYVFWWEITVIVKLPLFIGHQPVQVVCRCMNLLRNPDSIYSQVRVFLFLPNLLHLLYSFLRVIRGNTVCIEYHNIIAKIMVEVNIGLWRKTSYFTFKLQMMSQGKKSQTLNVTHISRCRYKVCKGNSKTLLSSWPGLTI